MRVAVKLTVNGQERELLVEARRTLLDALRYDLGLIGTKEGCGNGNCGTCTVLLNGRPVNSCLVLAVEAQGKTVTTIEGVAPDGQLHPLQQAFVREGAVQCGFCTPGIVLSAKALLETNPQPSEAEVRLAIAGNLCRCTGYDKVVRAIMSVGQGPSAGSGQSPSASSGRGG